MCWLLLCVRLLWLSSFLEITRAKKVCFLDPFEYEVETLPNQHFLQDLGSGPSGSGISIWDGTIFSQSRYFILPNHSIICCSDIWAKSEPNLVCLSKNLSKKRTFVTNPTHDKSSFLHQNLIHECMNAHFSIIKAWTNCIIWDRSPFKSLILCS